MTTDIRPYEIRPARPAEYDAVGALTVSAYASDGFLPAGSDYELTLRAAADRAEKAELWVAATTESPAPLSAGLPTGLPTGLPEEPPAELLGTVTFCPPGSVYREIGLDDEGEFRMLGVSAAARGLGVGTALTERCITRSRELGLRRVVLSSATYMTAAHRIYQRLGFVRVPDRDWSPIAGVDLYAFSLDL